MTSILTNNGAMTALQTLRSINKNLTQTQNEISTGKTINSARDGAAIWSISKVMESDMKGFQQVKNSLSLGQSTIAIARNAAESVTDMLTQMKGLIVSAQAENVDRAKIQTDIDALASQIQSITGAAQFNGLNLVTGQDDVNVLASLDRAASGAVTASDIVVARADLTFSAGVMGTGASLTGAGVLTAADAAATGGNVSIQAGANQNFDDSSTREFSSAANSMTVTLSTNPTIGDQFNLQIGDTTVSYTAAAATPDDVAAGLTLAINAAGIEGITATVAAGVITIASTSRFDDITINADTTSASTQFVADVEGAAATTAASSFTGAVLQARASEVTFTGAANVADGDGYRVSIGGTNFDYVAGRNETMEDVVRGLKVAIDAGALNNISTNVVQDSTTGNWILQVDNNGSALALTASGFAGGTATGGLAGVDSVDVTTNLGAEAALANVETWINASISAASSFGSAQGRVDTQAEFIQSMVDNFKSGIGTLVDADMEAASARLQALQVQQQLGIQALSIANQSPQTILALFR